jgi:hypothetical protein
VARPTLYLETTIPSYYAARPSADLVLAAHQHLTRVWWDDHKAAYDIFVSELVLQEASRGDPDAAEKRGAVVVGFPILRVTEDAIHLARIYLKRLPLPPSADADALHLALATINGMDYLLTWNCRHIARGSVIRALPAVNTEHGYETPTICTPEELRYENPRDMDGSDRG